jgi:hypothetical protein
VLLSGIDAPSIDAELMEVEFGIPKSLVISFFWHSKKG